MTTALAALDGKLLDGLQFCGNVYQLFESIRATADGPSRLRRRMSKVEKRLIEELLPICAYLQSRYRVGRYISVRWRAGNQQCDAELVQEGAYVTHGYYPGSAFLEVTCAMHRNEHLSRELLDKEGGAFGLEGLRRLKSGAIESVPVSYLNNDFIARYATILLGSVAKKAEKPYPENTALIVQCNLNNLYLPSDWAELILRVQETLPAIPFSEVFVYDPVCQYSHTFYRTR
jgi:hypothetical protein